MVKRRQTCLLLSPNRPFATFACIPIITFIFVLFFLGQTLATFRDFFLNTIIFFVFVVFFVFAPSFWFGIFIQRWSFFPLHLLSMWLLHILVSSTITRYVCDVYVLVQCTEMVSYVSFHFIELSFSRAHCLPFDYVRP